MSRVHASRQHGFTLLEVLVALTIVAVALAAAMRAMGGLVLASVALDRDMLANWSAGNRLAELSLQHAWPEPGVRGFACPQGNTPLWCEETVMASPNPVFRRVEIAVYPSAAKELRLAWLVTLVPDDAHTVF